MTLLEFFNRFFFQWFFVRLARVIEDGKQTGWTWLVGIVPTTGWTNEYRYVSAETILFVAFIIGALDIVYWFIRLYFG